MLNSNIFEATKGKLIVSCQALEDEPLFDPYIMARMAYSAVLGGASAIRANSPEQIKRIRAEVSLPIIGLYKSVYPDSDVYITPTMEEVKAVADCGVDMIAIDATNRARPKGQTLADFFCEIKAAFPHILFMADCSTFEEAVEAEQLGFDCVATTLSGYTVQTKGASLPNIPMIQRLKKTVSVPIIAEGGIWCPEQAVDAITAGAWAVVVGTAITRPMDITKRFATAITASSK